MTERELKLKNLLDEHYDWPDYFHFKFILKDKNHLVQFEEVFEQKNVTQKESRTGKYLSLTCRKLVNSSDEVLALYSKVSKIEGVITL